jgi:hypothetical protein
VQLLLNFLANCRHGMEIIVKMIEVYKMKINHRYYKLLAGFNNVLKYLTDSYNIETLNSYLLPQFLNMYLITK